MKIVFFGTPEAALPALDALIESRHEVTAVVTAADRPKGRGMKVEPSPVKKKAAEAGLKVLAPSTLRSEEVQRTLEALPAGIFVVTAYGLLLPAAVLNIPELGCVNVHFSLLPRLRGAAPVQWALIEGHEETGVTIMQMDEGLDTGPILSQVTEPVAEDDDAGNLQERLALKGAGLLVRTLDLIESGRVTATPQDDSLATPAPKLSAADAHIDWSLPASEVLGRIRAMSPRPGAWNVCRSGRLKIFAAAVTEEPSGGPPGALTVRGDELLVESGTARVALTQVQLEGKRRMGAADFLRGHHPVDGEQLL